MQVALAFLPANVVSAVVALGFSARIVSRFGIRAPFAVGVLFGALGLALFAAAPVNGNVLTDVLPGGVSDFNLEWSSTAYLSVMPAMKSQITRIFCAGVGSLVNQS